MSTPGSALQRWSPTLGERALIERIRGGFRRRRPPSLVGVGDDAAVMRARARRAAGADHGCPRRGRPLRSPLLLLRRRRLQGAGGQRQRHRRDGRHAAAGAALADAARRDTAVQIVDALLDGVVGDGGGLPGVTLAGGNITRSPGPLIVDVSVIGQREAAKGADARRRPCRAIGLYVTGTIGAAAAGLDWLRRRHRAAAAEPPTPAMAECVRRHRRPEPRLRIGALARPDPRGQRLHGSQRRPGGRGRPDRRGKRDRGAASTRPPCRSIPAPAHGSPRRAGSGPGRADRRRRLRAAVRRAAEARGRFAPSSAQAAACR